MAAEVEPMAVEVAGEVGDDRRPHPCVEPVAMGQQERGPVTAQVVEDRVFAVGAGDAKYDSGTLAISVVRYLWTPITK